MHPDYSDIIQRAGQPLWFDERAVPRYCAFTPDAAADMHGPEIALVEIQCQVCGTSFQVTFSRVNERTQRISSAIRSSMLRYGDPPNVRCCGAGSTMTSVPVRVLQYWSRHDEQYTREKGAGRVVSDHRFFEWVRDSSLEVEFDRRPKGREGTR